MHKTVKKVFCWHKSNGRAPGCVNVLENCYRTTAKSVSSLTDKYGWFLGIEKVLGVSDADAVHRIHLELQEPH